MYNQVKAERSGLGSTTFSPEPTVRIPLNPEEYEHSLTPCSGTCRPNWPETAGRFPGCCRPCPNPRSPSPERTWYSLMVSGLRKLLSSRWSWRSLVRPCTQSPSYFSLEFGLKWICVVQSVDILRNGSMANEPVPVSLLMLYISSSM